MWSWNQFRNLPKNQGLSAQEQARQYFIHQSNMMMEASSNSNSAAAASSAAAGAGAGAGGAGGGGRRKPSFSLNSALESLNLRYEEITDLVPNIYKFWDEYVLDDDEDPILTGINDGGNDMYDGGNYMNTNLTADWDDINEGQVDEDPALMKASIPYTHTQADNDDEDNEYFNPPMDGEIELGDSYFGAGSRYFTNMYPGLFIMIADGISISEFNISGDVGSDGDGIGAGYVESVITDWTLFYKTNTEDDSDPTINQLILVPGSSTGIIHEYDTSSEYDDHRISGIDDRSRIIYAVVARQPEEDVLSEEDAILVSQKILEIVGSEVPQPGPPPPPIEYNFDITADWNLLEPQVTNRSSFREFLQSGQDGDGNSNNLTDVVIRDFSLINGRLRCNLFADGDDTDLNLVDMNITSVISIGNITGTLNVIRLYENNITSVDGVVWPSANRISLGDNAITSFDNITWPSGLLELELYNNSLTSYNPTIVLPNGLEELDLSGNQIVSFDPTLPLPSSLLYLYLYGNQLTSFDSSILPSELRELDLGDNNITSVNDIIWPELVYYLGLYDNQIVNFDPAIALPDALQQLDLGGNQIVTFDPTIALPSGLQNLYLSGNQIVTFDPTITLPSSLTTLGLDNNEIVTFDPSIALPSGLQTLYLGGNQMVNFDPSIALPDSLQQLDLSSNQVSMNFTPSLPLPDSLQSLELFNSNIVTFDPAHDLPSGLGQLNLNNNQIVNFTPSNSLGSGLTYLSLSDNQIVNFDPAVALPSGLTYLSLSDNQIVTFDPAVALPNSITILDLSNNQIVDFDPSIALPNSLQQIYLRDNQIVDFDPSIALSNITSNLDLYLNNNQIVTFNPSIALPDSLRYLYLDGNQMTIAGYTASEPWANAMSVIGNRYIYFRNNIDSVIDTDLESILQSKGWSVQGSLDPLPFDITANWSLTTPDVVDESSFRTFLQSGQDGNGNSNNLSSLVISNFSLINGRLSCNLSHTDSDFYLSGIQISNIESIGNVKYLQNLNLSQNQIVNFDPAVALPDSLTSLNLGNNQIVNFDPSDNLPSGLEYLLLNNNQIVDFDPSIALPTGLKLLNLTDNQIVTFNPAVALPNSITNLDLSRNQIVTFNPTIALPNSLQSFDLTQNQIVTFNPTIALPNSINALGLISNQMTTAGYIASEPWANSMSVRSNRGIWIGNNINSINGTNLETILQSKGWNIN